MTPDACRWLLTDEATPIVAELVGKHATPAVVMALRKRVGGSAERASAALELAELRQRATAKFQHADRMFFTRKSYEQATDEWIARYKAERFSGADCVVDACCGIGGDLIGLANSATQAIGVDADPVMTEFAKQNVEAYDADAALEAVELAADTLPECDAWHTDPDRRPAGKRTTQPDLHEPSLETLAAWRNITPAAAIKLAPAARLPSDWEADAELEWISRGGECRQLVAWCGPLANNAGQRAATVIDRAGNSASITGDADLPIPSAERLGRWVHEPDAAVLAADLVGVIAERHELEAVTPPLPYLTSDAKIDDPLVASFEVVELMPLDRKRLAGWLVERNVGRLEIKCRGVDLRPESLRRELKPRGDQEATLLVFPDTAGKVQVVIANRTISQ